MALNRRNSGLKIVEQEKKAALTALNRKKSGINGGEPEKSGVNSVEQEKKRH